MVFLSYCWAESSYADCIEEYLSHKNFNIIRDKSDLRETDCISNFMDNKIEDSDYLLLLISEAYLKSYNCLYEALGAYKKKNKKNLIPIIFRDAQVFDFNKHSEYILYWQEERKKYISQNKDLDAINITKISEKIRQIEYILNYIGDFLAFISDIKCIIVDNKFEFLAKIHVCLCNKMLEKEIRQGRVLPNSDIELLDKNVLCVDFGTSYTLASVVDACGTRHLIPNICGQIVTRSTVELRDNGSYSIGVSGTNTIKNIKRLIGIKNCVKHGREKFDIRILIAMIIKSVLRNAEEYLNIKIERVLMAIPANFDLSQKKILKDSVEIAGARVVRFIPESSAEAFLLPNSADGETKSYAIVDLGGGTLDISLVESGDGVYEIVYIDGDENFGSIDFDDAITKYLVDKVCKELSCKDVGLFEQISQYSEHIKCQFNRCDSISVSCEIYGEDGNVNIISLSMTKEEFESIIKELSEKFKHKLVNLKTALLNSYHICINQISAIYLTGQGTKLYIIRDIITEMFPECRMVDEYQESALIQGLSIQSQCFAEKLLGKYPSALLLNMSYFSLVLMCHEYDKEENVATISRVDNLRELILLDSPTIPIIRGISLQFVWEDDNIISNSYRIEMYEKKTSGEKKLLHFFELKPQHETEYVLLVDIDQNFDGEISLCEEQEGDGNKGRKIKTYLF